MKTTFQANRFLALVLASIFLFSGCAVYKKTPVTLDEAVLSNTMVKLHTIYNETLTFRRIKKTEDNKFYGINLKDGINVSTPINKAEINSVRIKNKKVSAAGNYAIVAPIIGLVLLVSGAIAIM